MRRFVVLLCLFLSVGLSPCGAAPFRWRIDGLKLSGRNDSLVVSMKWVFTEGAIRDNEALVICASLRNTVGELLLTPVCLYGTKPYYSDTFASGSFEERRILKGYDGVSFECTESFPREEWMDTLRVSFTVYDWNRHDGRVPVSTSNRWTFIRKSRPDVPDFPWENLVPKKSMKSRKVVFSSPVAFADVSTKFNIHEGGNEEDIPEFLDKVRKLSSSQVYHISESSLSVSLPPKGASAESLRRSKACAESLADYLSRAGAFKFARPACVGAGEEWAGVLGWVNAGSLKEDARLMEILTSEMVDDERYLAIREERPTVFGTLECGCFPFVGKAVYEAWVEPLTFVTRSFYRTVYDELPEAMVPYDFLFLASDFEVGSDEWLEIMAAGAQMYPESEELNMDVAMALIRAGKERLAVPFLRNIGESDDAKYVYAAWLFRNGRYDEALDIFEVLRGRAQKYGEVWAYLEPFVRWKTGNVGWERAYN